MDNKVFAESTGTALVAGVSGESHNNAWVPDSAPRWMFKKTEAFDCITNQLNRNHSADDRASGYLDQQDLSQRQVIVDTEDLYYPIYFVDDGGLRSIIAYPSGPSTTHTSSDADYCNDQQLAPCSSESMLPITVAGPEQSGFSEDSAQVLQAAEDVPLWPSTVTEPLSDRQPFITFRDCQGEMITSYQAPQFTGYEALSSRLELTENDTTSTNSGRPFKYPNKFPADNISPEPLFQNAVKRKTDGPGAIKTPGCDDGRRNISNGHPPRLYEYLLKQLDEPRHPENIRWTDRSAGEFEVVNSESLSHDWGKLKSKNKKNNMTWDKLSRSMRYYYKTGHMIPSCRRFIYRFNTLHQDIKEAFSTCPEIIPTFPVDVSPLHKQERKEMSKVFRDSDSGYRGSNR